MKHQAKKEAQDFERDLKELSTAMEKHKKTLYYIRLSEKNKDQENIGSENYD